MPPQLFSTRLGHSRLPRLVVLLMVSAVTVVSVVLCGVVLGGNCEAQAIVRGPYLQRGTPSSMTVRWRTDTLLSTHIEYGIAPSQLTSKSKFTELSLDHEVVLSSLTPQTRYYYRVMAGARVLAGGDDLHSFVTFPSGGDEPLRVWVVGDAGSSGSSESGEDPRQGAVRDAFLATHPVNSLSLFLMLGDNAYRAGTDREYQKAVFAVYHKVLRSVVTWPTQGNHDLTSNAYYKVFSLPTQGESGGIASGTEFYYSFDYGNVHFICLNSEVADGDFRTSMLSWLREDLAANTREWTVAFWHHPPYSKGSHDSDIPADSDGKLIWMRENVLPILDTAGVDLVMSGHSHSYERSKFIRGHYQDSKTFSDKHVVIPGDGHDDADRPYVKTATGKVPQSGAVYVVAGNGGQVGVGALNHPVMVVSLLKLGSMLLEIDANELAATMIGADGSREDYFTIRKDPRRPRTVKNLRAEIEASGCAVKITWDTAQDVQRYALFRSTREDGRGLEIGSVQGSQGAFSHSLPSVAAGEYFYSVRALNAVGSGPWGAAVKVVVPQKRACSN